MKKYLTLVLTTLIALSTFAAGNTHSKKFKMKPGKYRQMLYLPQAHPAAGVYQLDTVNLESNIRIVVIGDREGDYFKIRVNLLDSTKTLIMQQLFFMDGTRTDEQEKDSWFVSYKKDELNKFLFEYFGVTIKPRRQFIKEQRKNEALKASGWEAFLLDK